MPISSLNIHKLRNIHHAELSFSPFVNLIYGVNGSGKTSILEAIHLLATARSFRTHKSQSLINNDSSNLVIFGEIHHRDSRAIPIGVEKTNAKTIVRIQGQNASSIAQLLGLLPVQYLGPESFRVLELGPAYRRKILDWGVFHVEHSFFRVWHRYDKLLQQRNSLLRQKKDQETLACWDRELIDAGNKVTALRKNYLSAIDPYFKTATQQLFAGKFDASVEFDQGWDKTISLADKLMQNLDADLRTGHTQAGPHRADLDFSCKNKLAKEVLSRGQQKILVAAFRLAQLAYHNVIYPDNPGIVLADDLFSELDEDNARKVFSMLMSMGAQVFLTHLTQQLPYSLDNILIDNDVRMFHVEQGMINTTVL